MTAVADTRLLLTFHFPPSDTVRQSILTIMEDAFKATLLLPTVVLTEYLKIAGGQIGVEAVLAQLQTLEARGARVEPLDREVAVMAGRLLLAHPAVPVADAVIAATARTRHADQVITDDPHFKLLGVKTRWI